MQARVRERVLRLFKPRELLLPEAMEGMREWGMRAAFLKTPI
jgi:hypothetical protein